MKKSSASLQIRTREASVNELIQLTGLHLSSSSHEIGEIGGDGRPFKMTVGVFDSDNESIDMNSSVQNLLDRLSSLNFDDIRKKLPDVCITMSICVYFDTANVSLDILPNHANFLGQRNIVLNISCYPSCFE